jgi:hypothetical protein
MAGLARRKHTLGDLKRLVRRNIGRFIKQQNAADFASGMPGA